MSIIRSDEEVGTLVNIGVAILDFLVVLYSNISSIKKFNNFNIFKFFEFDIIVDEIIMIIIGVLSSKKLFKKYKILRFAVLFFWYKGLNKRIYDHNFCEHLRTFAYLTVGVLPLIREG